MSPAKDARRRLRGTASAQRRSAKRKLVAVCPNPTRVQDYLDDTFATTPSLMAPLKEGTRTSFGCLLAITLEGTVRDFAGELR
ncbi:hypothetical protein RGR602_CH01631 [Rhizobium gallicum bv. gallicum R602sp]|uniref:Uncharacterized protein n=1 Tax=Rhizobium gallicum bv. gallicum R602sp TaxID=1041138 RepID=A0A0B4X2S5_9HYPH|nr:hypothetical protein RGR602_CH01631 [Rhizobium gallicum bv. gallicum R602sp]